MKTGFLRSKKLAGGLGLLLALILLLGISVPVAGNGLPELPMTFIGTSHVCVTPTEVVAQVQGVGGTVEFILPVDGGGNFNSEVPADTGGEVKDGGEDGDTVFLKVEGQELFSTAWVGGQINDGTVPQTGPPWYVPLDLDALPYLTTASGGNGSVDTPGEGTYGPYTCGDTQTLLATADEDYVFSHWSGDNGTIANPLSNATTITMNGIYSITANFEPEAPPEDCELDPSSTAGGHVEVPGEEGPYPYDCDTDADIEAVVDDDCYEFDGWTSDGVVADPGALVTTILMDGDYWVTANFVKIEYDLTTASTTGGHVETPGQPGPFTYDCCTDVPIEAVVDDVCYEFSHWSGDIGTILDDEDPTTEIHIEGNHSITANFVKIEYDLTTNSTTGGHVEVPGQPGPFTYDCCTDVPIEAVVDDGDYEFSHWSGDTGTILDDEDPTTEIHMEGNHSITAVFILKGVEYCQLTTASTAGGSVTTPGEPGPYPYVCGEDADIEATATGCYNFAYWAGDNATIANTTAASTTITMNGNYSITAVFELAEGLDEVEIEFVEGWNTFSTPIYLHDCVKYWEGFESVNNLDIEMIYGYDSATQEWVPVYLNEEIKPLYGYYVKIKPGGGGTASIIPDPEATVLPSRNLNAGVHLIGIAPASLEDTVLTTALFTLYWAENGFMGYELVVSPSVNDPSWAYTRDEPDPPMMQIGRAYWLVMANADIYAGSTTTG